MESDRILNGNLVAVWQLFKVKHCLHSFIVFTLFIPIIVITYDEFIERQ